MTTKITNLGDELNKIVDKYKGIIVWISVNEQNNKVIAHLNSQIKTVDNYKESIVKSISEVLKKVVGYSKYKVCTTKGS